MTLITMADDTAQFLLRPNRNLIRQLDSLAKRFGRKSGNQVAVEILEQYAEFYEQAEQAKQNVLMRQKGLLSQSLHAIGELPFEADEIETKLGGELVERRGQKTSIAPRTKKVVKRSGKGKNDAP